MRRSATALVASALIVGSIAGYEGYSAVAYRDAVGVATSGFGTTGGVQMGPKTSPARWSRRVKTSTASRTGCGCAPRR